MTHIPNQPQNYEYRNSAYNTSRGQWTKVGNTAYTRKDYLKSHIWKKKHNIVLADRTKKFFCPFKCDSGPFRTSGDLLQHCDMSHDDNLGIIEETIYHYIMHYYNNRNPVSRIWK